MKSSFLERSAVVFLGLSFVSLFINQAPHNLTLSILLFLTMCFAFTSTTSFSLSIKNHYFFYSLIGLYFILFLSLNLYHFGFNADFKYAIKRSRWLLYSLIFIPTLPYLIFNKSSNKKTFLKIAITGLCSVSVLIIIDTATRLIWGAPSTSVWFKSSLNNIFSSRAAWTYNPIPFSKIAVFAAGFLIMVRALFKATAQRLSLDVLAFLLFASSILSLTRATWLGFILCVPFLLIKYPKRKYFLGAALLLCLTITSVLTVPKFKERVFALSNLKKYSTHYRVEHWKANLKVVKNNPILGVGYAANRKKSVMQPYMNEFHRNLNRVYGKHPHNEYLDIAAGLGVIGLLLFLSILSYPLLYKLKTIGFYQASKIDFAAMLFLLYIYATAMFDKITLTSWSMIIFCWAILLYKPEPEPKTAT